MVTLSRTARRRSQRNIPAVRTSAQLEPSTSLPPGAAPGASGWARLDLEGGRGRDLQLDLEDLGVIGDEEDADFCRGFYEVVLVARDARSGTEREIRLPDFPGLVMSCTLPGRPQGSTRGALHLELRPGVPLDPRGLTLRVFEVEPEREARTGAARPGADGAPFVIARRNDLALEGALLPAA